MDVFLTPDKIPARPVLKEIHSNDIMVRLQYRALANHHTRLVRHAFRIRFSVSACRTYMKPSLFDKIELYLFYSNANRALAASDMMRAIRQPTDDCRRMNISIKLTMKN